MNLDARAARASRSLQLSVAGAAPPGMPSVMRRRRLSMATSFAAAAVFALAVVGIASAMPNMLAPDTGEAAHSTESSVPADPETPVVVEPDDKTNEGELVDMDDGTAAVSVRQANSVSDDREPWTRFYGNAAPGSVVTATSNYGAADLVVDTGGEFSLKLFFHELPPPGEEFPIVVTVDEADYHFGFTSLWDPDSVDVTAHQVYGFSDDPDPYEKFFGTAAPGLPIVAESVHGSADTVAGEDGRWDLKLWFDGPPAGESFDIDVLIGDEVFTFGFVSTYEPESIPVSVGQVNTSSDSSSPYAHFVGSGSPGTLVEARSPYGNHAVTIPSSGEFSLKLWLSPLPPAGDAFEITVLVGGSTHGTYPFTSYFAESKGGQEDPPAIGVSQWNTESDSPEPYVKFNVTGPVGTQVQIVSPYGSTSRTLESTDEYVKLWFSSLPPAGEEFQVTVKIDGETWGTYPFTSWYEDAEEPPPPIEKTAHSTFGSCSEDPPYDVYHGTAPEGTNISITSSYGSGSTTANGSGEWSKKVFFEGAPLDEPFTVTVDVGGTVFQFDMVVTGGS